MITDILIAIGSNLGDRKQNLLDAVNLLDFITDIKRSSIHETKALLKKGSPKQWDKDFYNIVLLGKTSFNPTQILERLQLIEKHLGRDLNSPRWSPRVIDLDLLLHGDTILNSKDLVIPHPEMLKRDFVMKPALEIAPHMIHPVSGKSLLEIMTSKG